MLDSVHTIVTEILRKAGRLVPTTRTLLAIGLIAVTVSFVSVGTSPCATTQLPRVEPPGTWFLMGPHPPASPSEGRRPGRPSMRGIGWQVVDYLSALGALIINVETHRLTETSEIARELVDPLKDRYVEVLVYFREPGTELATERVQWTPTVGYVAIDISTD